MEVNVIMNRAVKAVKASDSIKDIAIMICTGTFSGTPVVDDEDQIIGMISEKDILKAMFPSQQDFHQDKLISRNFDHTHARYREVMERTVNDCMSKRISAVSSDAHIMEAASIMLRRTIRRIPVIDKERRLVGIVSQGDIHQAIFKDKVLEN